MRIKINRNIILLILCFTMVFPVFADANVNKNISVSLMDKALEFQVPPRNIDGRVMVPLRKIFEEVGLEVGWDPASKKITGRKENIEINLQVGNSYASINGQGGYIDAPPIIVGGSTLVPIRFIAEATGLDVIWDQDTKTVYIKEPIKGLVHRENSDKFIAGYSEIGGLNLKADGSILNVHSKNKNPGRSLIAIYDRAGNAKLRTVIDPKSNGDIKTNIDLKDLNGSFTLNQFIEDKNINNSFNGYYANVPINIKDNKINFELAMPYEDNYKSMIKRANLYTDIYLDLDYLKAKEKEELTNLSKSITKGKTTDYEKILAIHDWLGENIYYNYDGLYSGDYGDNHAYSVYKNKIAVCQGYANLLQVLGRAQGIPTRLVTGYALGIGIDSTWNKESMSKGSNHAWNEAFVDGRWIIIDATWDTGNRFENGKFVKGKQFSRYFDPSLQYFSLSHRIISN